MLVVGVQNEEERLKAYPNLMVPTRLKSMMVRNQIVARLTHSDWNFIH